MDDPKTCGFRRNTKFIFIAAGTLFCGYLLGLAQIANAQEVLTVAGINSTLRGEPAPVASADPALSALSAFAQQITAAPASASAAQGRDSQFDDKTYAALRDFAQGIGAPQPESLMDWPKMAAADNAVDALREFLSGGSSSQNPPAGASPDGPVAGGKHSSAPVEANFVGAKVCMACHASQAESFSHTLMGRIGQTQKGKFDCENCHGPGSAHAKAGGGRGVGGIISFRPEDQSRTAEENNAICLTCHERGDRTNWHGSTHETRGLMCTNCHTIMKTVSRKNQLKTAFEPETCFQCHKDRRAQMFRSSHMPLREGKMVCSDCHNPHGASPRPC